MPMDPLNNLRGEQWDFCAQCGFLYPNSLLRMQKGMKRCTENCIDNMEVERHSSVVAKMLGNRTEEGVDRRWLDEKTLEGLEEVEL